MEEKKWTCSMAGTEGSSPFGISIGNCKVEVEEEEGNGVECKWHWPTLHISFSDNRGGKVKISEIESKDTPLNMVDKSFMLLDPGYIDSQNKSLPQQVLRLYKEELPNMNYTGKTRNNSFLEQCMSTGKYKTLILMLHGEGHDEIMAALSYQIVPNDTRHAEIPLAAVRSQYRLKGIGRALYMELRKRLENVGITTIFCWADETSEWFWLNQGFTSVGGVDTEGKISKLPIKADLKKALSFPRGSILMVAHAKDARSVTKSQPIRSLFQNIDLQQTKACPSGQSVKRHIWESSLSSLKSKRVKVNRPICCALKSSKGLPCDNCSMQSSGLKDMVQELPVHSEGSRSNPVFKQNLYRIMFMNMADDDKRKKTFLTKIVEELGGSVTCDGTFCTHIITGIARWTLKFSIALSSGAWIVSQNWLMESFRRKKFVGESEFILEDEEYLSNYKTPLRDAVALARANPHSLLQGYHICLGKHIHPPAKILRNVIQSAGGNVIRSLDNVKDPSKSIFLASEEDFSDAFTAAKMGVMSFTSDWLIDCVMTQQLDMEATQFVVSLS